MPDIRQDHHAPSAAITANAHGEEVKRGDRFEFGDNWARFLSLVDEERIALADRSLQTMLGRDRLDGMRFLDAGSGSGLFSLAARRLGARVHSFDYDPQSVACTRELKRRYAPDDEEWQVEPGSVLDGAYLAALGSFDVVYSWGVLHHTGDMWRAMENLLPLVAPGGLLFIAIYNDQGVTSRAWSAVKWSYNHLPARLRGLVLYPAAVRLWGRTLLMDLLRGHPLRSWRNYEKNSMRGMDGWRDVVDWVGGWPFEVARPEAVVDFFVARGMEPVRVKTVGGGIACNEFVFVRP